MHLILGLLFATVCRGISPPDVFVNYFADDASCTLNKAVPCAIGVPVRFQVLSYNVLPECLTDAVEWDFGDGMSAYGSQAIHAYQTAGTYMVRAKVTDALHVTTIEQTVMVNAPPDDNRRISFNATIVANVVRFRLLANPPHTVSKWKIDFGDGTQTAVTGEDPIDVTHAYKYEGRYGVFLSSEATMPGFLQFVSVGAPIPPRSRGARH
jgi:PKD repeat protein